MALGGYTTRSGLPLAALLERFTEAKVAPALGVALYKEGSRILSESQPLVPVDTGTLRASGYVTPPVREGDTVKVTIGYGGPAAKINPKTGESSESYAIYVHENLEAHHPVGQAKYLETPFNAAKQGIDERIIAEVRAQLAGGAVAPGAPEEPA